MVDFVNFSSQIVYAPRRSSKDRNFRMGKVKTNFDCKAIVQTGRETITTSNVELQLKLELGKM